MAVYTKISADFDATWSFFYHDNDLRSVYNRGDFIICHIYISEDEWVFKSREMLKGAERFEMALFNLLSDKIDFKTEFHELNLHFPKTLSKSDRHKLHCCSCYGKITSYSRDYNIDGPDRRITTSVSKKYIDDLFEKNKVDYTVIKERMDPLKKELMEYCYHPSRINLKDLYVDDI